MGDRCGDAAAGLLGPSANVGCIGVLGEFMVCIRLYGRLVER